MHPEVETKVREVFPRALERLKRFCRQPSVSAQHLGIQECAQLVREMLEEVGLSSRVIPTAVEGYPVVFGEMRGRSPRTILFYNHYDVQPAEPFDEWLSPPFEPEEREGRLYARGVSDNKGHIVSRLAAIEALLQVYGELPCSVKFVIEGAEEIGSPGLHRFVEEHRELLLADACIWEGGGVNWRGQPQVVLGLKGILYVELECRAASRDSHSSYATIVPNPAWRLVWALSTLKDAQERVLIPGFYDDVRPPSEEELRAIDAIPPEEERLRESLGLKEFLLGLKGQEVRRRHLLEPTCTICGIISGYTGEGSKTVLPSWARAKIDFRLVPDQRPEDILAKLKAHLQARGFGDVEVKSRDGGNPARTPMDSPWVALVRETAQEVYGLEPVIVPTMAGSGPMYSFSETLGLPVVTSGIGHPEDRIHAPNENIRLDDLFKGILHIAAIMERFGA
jgi:acetylornithine deacetylase/succinyl-diaminopimelate desuccinylase-like protein